MQISVLVKHEHRYREFCETLLNMAKLPEHKATKQKK